MTTMVNRWQDVLTPAQRANWEEYANNVPVTNRIGNTTHLTGQNWFVGNNVPRIQAGIPIVDAAPEIFDRGDPGTIEYSSSDAINGITLAIGDSPAWAGNDDADAIIYYAQPVAPSRKFIQPRFRLSQVVTGSAITPITEIVTSPANFAWGYPATSGLQTKFRIRIAFPDGRLSSPVEGCVTLEQS